MLQKKYNYCGNFPLQLETALSCAPTQVVNLTPTTTRAALHW